MENIEAPDCEIGRFRFFYEKIFSAAANHFNPGCVIISENRFMMLG